MLAIFTTASLASIVVLKQEDCLITRCVPSTQHLYFTGAGSTKTVDADRIFSLVYLFEQAYFQQSSLLAVEKTLEDAELYPGAKTR